MLESETKQLLPTYPCLIQIPRGPELQHQGPQAGQQKLLECEDGFHSPHWPPHCCSALWLSELHSRVASVRNGINHRWTGLFASTWNNILRAIKYSPTSLGTEDLPRGFSSAWALGSLSSSKSLFISIFFPGFLTSRLLFFLWFHSSLSSKW